MGIIPAYAGNTRWCWSWCRTCRDHPRLRGEHRSAIACDNSGLGSSPLTRGTQCQHPAVSPSPGIIPAYAGNTRFCRCPRRSCRDHPRLRGEHYGDVMKDMVYQGSSPLTRGTLAEGMEITIESGIIPAYAGNTHCRHKAWHRQRDHPRLRGEHSVKPEGPA